MCRLSCPRKAERERKSPKQTLSRETHRELRQASADLASSFRFRGPSVSVSTCSTCRLVGPHLSLCFNLKPVCSVAFLRVHSIHAVPMKAFSKFVIKKKKKKANCFHHFKTVIFNGNLLLHNSRAGPFHNK